MKHGLRFLFSVAIAFGLSACGMRGAGTMTPFAQAPAARSFSTPARGTILAMRFVTRFTKQQMNGDLGLEGQVITEIGGAPKCEVALYSIVYATIGAHGEPANASEGFFVPGKGCAGPFTLIGYGQGTNTVKAMKMTEPSKKNIEPVTLASIFAAHGYPVAATDYLGLGYSSYPYQPYLVGNSEASAIIDAMRAARTAAATLAVPLAPKVFLTGYSQGGHSILSTQRVIEAENASEFPLVADSPQSGLYALTLDTLGLLAHPGPGRGGPVFWAYFLTGYQKTYGNAYAQPVDAFKDPYAGYVENLLPVRTYKQQAALNGTTLPLSARELLQRAFRSAFATDPTFGARLDVKKNDLLHGWTPKAPVYLCGGSADPVVAYKNSQLAYDYFRRKGVTVSLLDVNPFMPPSVPRSLYHDAALVLCHAFERVNILDRMQGSVRAGIPHPTLRGTIGPFESPLLP